MMLLDRAASLTAKIVEYEKLKSTAAEAAAFQTRATQFLNLSEKLSQTSSSLREFAEAGVKVNFTSADAPVYAGKAKQLRTAILDNPSVLNDPPFDIRYEFVDRIAGIANGAEKALLATWRAYVGGRASYGSTEVLGALAAIPQFAQSVAKIRRCRSAIETLGNSVPSDPKATVTELDKLVAEHEKAWAELSAEDIPMSVVAFIRAAASEGAMLSLYSDEVKLWLNDRGLTTAFRIRLK
ncbi:hypothetical protein ACCS62_28350 [Rhizobium ruizarguesonis]